MIVFEGLDITVQWGPPEPVRKLHSGRSSRDMVGNKTRLSMVYIYELDRISDYTNVWSIPLTPRLNDNSNDHGKVNATKWSHEAP
jgi:hypothetical protein